MISEDKWQRKNVKLLKDICNGFITTSDIFKKYLMGAFGVKSFKNKIITRKEMKQSRLGELCNSLQKQPNTNLGNAFTELGPSFKYFLKGKRTSVKFTFKYMYLTKDPLIQSDD